MQDKVARSEILFSAALGLGIIVSPDTLATLGNVTGQAGWRGLAILALVLTLFLFLSRFLDADLPPVLSYLPWTCRMFAAIFLATGVLVSSGFVFNEVFLYWFPNFGFAFFLLGLILLLNLAGPGIARYAQVVFVFLVLAGLTGLAVYGLLKPAHTDGAPVRMAPSALILPFLLWVGFDLGAAADRDTGPSPAFLPTILAGGILFLAWSLAGLCHVSPEKIADSSIAPMIMARYIGGQTGRLVMGGIIISGSLAAVNALFLVCRTDATRMVRQGMLPSLTGRPWFLPAALTLATGGLMAGGMAGSLLLESWIRAIFIFWLAIYSLTAFMNFKTRKHPWAGAPAAVFLAAGIALTLAATDSLTIFRLIILISGIGLMPGIALTMKQSRTNLQ